MKSFLLILSLPFLIGGLSPINHQSILITKPPDKREILNLASKSLIKLLSSRPPKDRPLGDDPNTLHYDSSAPDGNSIPSLLHHHHEAGSHPFFPQSPPNPAAPYHDTPLSAMYPWPPPDNYFGIPSQEISPALVSAGESGPMHTSGNFPAYPSALPIPPTQTQFAYHGLDSTQQQASGHPFPQQHPTYHGSQPLSALAHQYPAQAAPPQPELVDLGSHHATFSPPCATLLSTSNCIVRVPDDGTHHEVQERGFMFAAGLVRNQCVLTIQDCTGSYTTSTTDYFFSSSGGCSVANSVCCECYGCGRDNLPMYMNSCAILFENAQCSMCQGFRVDVADGDVMPVMNELTDNKLSSMFILPGCEVQVFKDPGFMGDAAVATGPIDELPHGWNDAISSYYCTCSENNETTTTGVPLPPTTPFTPILTTVAPAINSTTMSPTTSTPEIPITTLPPVNSTTEAPTNPAPTTTPTEPPTTPPPTTSTTEPPTTPPPTTTIITNATQAPTTTMEMTTKPANITTTTLKTTTTDKYNEIY